LILIIEDEQELRAGLVTGLVRAGFDTAEAGDGDSGYAEILALRPDLVLCDIGLPGMRGDALLNRLRRDHPEFARLPFLFLTALADRDSILAGRGLGADDYLTKPIDLELLIASVHQRLEQGERWDAVYATDLDQERTQFLITLSERTQLSFLSAADVLNHLSDGVLLFNEAGKAIFINRVARRILSEEDGLALRNGTLTGMRSEDSQRVRHLLAAVLAPADGGLLAPVLLPRPSARRPYAMRACRLEPGLELEPDWGALAALFLSDPEARSRPSEAMLIALYDFTQTEARVAAHLTVGLSVNDVAETLRISRNTVHHHLKSIFRKTDTTRQSELVSLILSGLAGEPSTLPLPEGD
jgi:DNA-binding NarL/FixJ family response regulator